MTNINKQFMARVFALLTTVLAVSGLAQMPIFKRYYVSDIPGLGWLADFYFTHKLHYVAAIALLALLGWLAARWVSRWSRSWRLTGSGLARVVILAGVVLTGAVRMYKNQPGVSFSPEFTLVVDWTHLGLVMLLGIVALAVRLAGSGDYVVKRGHG